MFCTSFSTKSSWTLRLEMSVLECSPSCGAGPVHGTRRGQHLSHSPHRRLVGLRTCSAASSAVADSAVITKQHSASQRKPCAVPAAPEYDEHLHDWQPEQSRQHVQEVRQGHPYSVEDVYRLQQREHTRSRSSGEQQSGRSLSWWDVDPRHLSVPESHEEALVLLEQLQQDTEDAGTEAGLNLVAFSGGFSSSLAAYLVHSVFEGNCAACIAPPATPAQLHRAHLLADYLGMDLWEIPAAEVPPPAAANLLVGSADVPQAHSAPSPAPAADQPTVSPALQYTASTVRRHINELTGEPRIPQLVLFDGLHAGNGGSEAPLNLEGVVEEAQGLQRVSLLARLPEAAVRAVADAAGLPNWWWTDETADAALQVGGGANYFALAEAEAIVSSVLELRPHEPASIFVNVKGQVVVALEASRMKLAQRLAPQLNAQLAAVGLGSALLQVLASTEGTA